MKQSEIIDFLNKYNKKFENKGFRFVSLFGSYARGTEDAFSDIDLTYKIDHTIFYKDDAFAKLEKIDEIKKDLERIFQKRVDLIPADTNNTLIRENIDKEQIKIKQTRVHTEENRRYRFFCLSEKW